MPKVMKKHFFTALTLFIFAFAFGQEQTQQPKIEAIGDLFRVTVYYENGQIMQKGFMTKDNKLHASWESFYPNGNRKCVATYDQGDKVGVWFYWHMDRKTKVTYEKNRIVSVEELDLE